MVGLFARKRMIPVLAAVCLAAWALAAYGIALPAAAMVLSGTVLNGKGQPVPQARIYWQDADGRYPHFLRSDAAGHFRSEPVKAGLYDLRAEAEGMWSDWSHNVLIRPGQGAELTLRLVRKTPPPGTAPPAPK